MAGCTDIAANIEKNCADPLIAGAEDLMVVIKRSDWLNASVGVNVSNDQIIESIVLASGITGFSYQGMNKSILPKYELIKSDFSLKRKHEISFKIFDVSPTIKQEVEALEQGLYVVVIANKYHGTGGNASFEVYGIDSGLEVLTNVRDIGNVELGGAFDVVLSSSEEAHYPATLFVTNYAASKVVFDSLYV